MKAKILFGFFALFVASFLAVSLASAGFASAVCASNSNVTVCTTNTIPSTAVAGTSIPVSFSVAYTGAGTDQSVTFTNSTANIGSWNLPGSTVINATQTINRDASIGSLSAGTLNAVLRVKVQDNSEVSLSLPAITVTAAPSQVNLCPAGSSSVNLSISDIDIDNNGDGNDNEWELLDEVEIKVEVENIGVNDLENIMVEMALYQGNINKVNDLDFISADDEEQELGDLDEGDNDDVTFTFKVPADMDDGNYRLIFRAYPDGDSAQVCTQREETQTIDVQRETDDEKEVIVDDIEFPVQATCGETISGTFSVFNIGNDDQDQVLVRIFNTQLGLNDEIIIRENLNEGDEEDLDYSFTVPSNIANGRYNINFVTEYEYDEDDDQYDQESEDDFTTSLQVIGCGAGDSEDLNVDIGAELESTAQAGQELVIRATITNTGSETSTMQLSASGYQAWGDLDSISDRTLTLESGESQDVTFTFMINDDASGTESFTIETRSGSMFASQDVDVEIEGMSQGFSFGGNTLFWVIGLINLVLIILIVVVAVRLSRK